MNLLEIKRTSQIKTNVKLKVKDSDTIWIVLARNYNEILAKHFNCSIPLSKQPTIVLDYAEVKKTCLKIKDAK